MKNNIQSKISQIDQKVETLQKFRPIKPEFLDKINQKLKLDANFTSNNLEGNTLTIGETKSLILHQMSASIAKSVRDVEEMRGHIKAYEEFFGNLTDLVLTINKEPLELTEYLIKSLHKMILVEDKVDRFLENGLSKSATISAGNYKIHPNSVKTKNGMFNYSEPFQVPSLMSDLLEWYNTARSELHPVILSSFFQYKFLRIHPFGDGNGRMSRFLGNLILQSGGFTIAIIKDKNQYLNSLALTDNNFQTINSALQSVETSDFEPFIEFVAESLLETLDLVIRGAKGEDITEIEDVLKTLEIRAKSAKLGFSLQDILSDEGLLKQQNEQLEKLGNTIDAYIDRVLKHKFWQVEILERTFYYEVNGHVYENSFENIKLESQNQELTYSGFDWILYCKKPVNDEISASDSFRFQIRCVLEIDCIKIEFLENGEEIRKLQFKYLDSEFETKLKDFILKLDGEIDGIVKKTIMPF
jgi:Fic family protein